MTEANRGQKSRRIAGAINRLLGDTSGNVMPIMAAAIFPLIAMIGGAVDIGRMYMTQTRLQQACDSGALATRRIMAGTAPTAAEIAEGEKFFDFNFPAGSFGTTSHTRVYAAGATSGTVAGSATAVLPATLMHVFGYNTFNITALCGSTLNVPNTDIMFVLDTSGSMTATIAGDTQSKRDALKQAVKDFYKELGPGSAAGPGRIRYGFVPYAANTNVGKLVPTQYFRDTNTYTTRIANTSTVQTWAHSGIENVGTYGSYSPATRPAAHNTTYNTTASYNSWTSTTGTGNETVTLVGASSFTLPRVIANSPNAWGSSTLVASNSTNCKYNNTNPGSNDNGIRAIGDAVGVAGTATQNSYTTPTHPTSSRTRTHTQPRENSVTGYRYEWVSSQCRLRTATGKTSSPNTRWTQNRTATGTQPIAWTPITKVDSWSLQNATVNVSGLKNGTNWNNSFDAANLGETVLGSYTPSGSTSSTSYNTTTTLNVPWAGCVEEADSLTSITAGSAIGIPATAYDMQIDLKPTVSNQQWRPLLPAIAYDSVSGQHQAAASWNASGWAVCGTQASKLAQYTGDVVAGLSTSFAGYVDSLSFLGGTQHDIGMIWGSRFLSPDGIFSTENSDSLAPGGFQVSRHLVFMTDGAMDARNQSYGPWGIPRVDGRHVPTNTQDTDDGVQTFNDIHYRRMAMICNAAKSKGYTIWVIGFGIASLPASLSQCATDSDHAAVISNSAALKLKFKAIAETIGGLRLSV